MGKSSISGRPFLRKLLTRLGREVLEGIIRLLCLRLWLGVKSQIRAQRRTAGEPTVFAGPPPFVQTRPFCFNNKEVGS